jgi:nitroreductase
MEVYEAVHTVLAVRSFQSKPVPPDTIQRIVKAGHLTGSAMNSQPWHFIVVQDGGTLKKLGELATSGHYTAQAPLAIVVTIEKSRFSVSDASRAIQSMILTGWAEGIGSNWVGFFGLESVNPLLGIPDELEVLGILPFGYPVEDVGKGIKKRKPLSEVASRERFGQPFD